MKMMNTMLQKLKKMFKPKTQKFTVDDIPDFAVDVIPVHTPVTHLPAGYTEFYDFDKVWEKQRVILNYNTKGDVDKIKKWVYSLVSETIATYDIYNVVVQTHSPHDMANGFMLFLEKHGVNREIEINTVICGDIKIRFISDEYGSSYGLPTTELLIIIPTEEYSSQTYAQVVPIVSQKKHSSVIVIARNTDGNSDFADLMYDHSLDGKNDFSVIEYDETIERYPWGI